MVMKKDSIISVIGRYITIGLVLTSFICGVQVVAAPSCERVEIDYKRPIISKKFKKSDVEERVRNQAEEGFSTAKAKGIVGEDLARYVIEDNVFLSGKPLVSIFTLFKEIGWDVNRYLRSKSDQGIDDIFLVSEEEGTIDKRYNPIFHESKYNGQCHLELGTTKKICDQLSVQWIKANLRKSYQRSRVGIDLCFGDKTKIRITSCSECRENFLDIARWLREKLEAGQFRRTASILCADGMLTVHNVVTKK